jgi:hypothetical protein
MPSNKVRYVISIKDATPHQVGQRKAGTSHFEEAFQLPNSNRPELRHVLNWIDSRTSDLQKAVDTMLANPGTKLLSLSARFPIRTTGGGHYFNHTFDDIAVDGLEVDRLKANVIKIYESQDAG